MTVAQFLEIFPEFTSTASARITLFLSVAANLINQTQWGALANQGQALLTAHFLTVDSQNQIAASTSLPPGSVNAPITSKSVAGVSVTKEMSAVVMEKAGQFNASNYGIQYWQLAKMMGAGAIQDTGGGISIFPMY